MNNQQTFHWTVDKNEENLKENQGIIEAAHLLQQGEVIAFPTETVYGLGANALDEAAIAKIFIAKGRPNDNPLIVHIARREQLNDLVQEPSEKARALIESFWPGPLTLIFKQTGSVAKNVTAGLDTVAVRMPDHPVAEALLLASDLPLAAPSANLSGKPSPTAAEHVWTDLQGRVVGIIDGGSTGVGLESTVLDVTGEIPILFRPGGITKEAIESVVGPIQVDPALKKDDQAPRSPGMKYTHYAPQGDLFLVSEKEEIQGYVDKWRLQGKMVGVLATEESKSNYEADVIISCGSRANLASVANQLYDALRAFDKKGVELIFAEIFSEEGIGLAIMNRLEKASAGRIL
ncbi:L-threonylcarbamoyladenylate synthase [Alkalihalobacillus pseudalcaliphilus]|uniref:L-threonylcarbamoyladenylate synthase n=1 Tax=Alkalihalobacillus pseudalcaliphilus TaxID=79884 RepID=UPI00064D7DEF|nr:L-threonylcarbamoyladenylate synthase [Alkalihalobacillus pseudalcaliphilus]KMK78264.1 tRNA threonylcarbamoyladenosine biosynthesis protein [Alkalihalobacillus pseudalcaliphilus]